MLGFDRRAIRCLNQRSAGSLFTAAFRAIFSRDELSELGVVQTDASCCHLGNQCAAIAIQKSSAQKKVANPTPGSGNPHGTTPIALAIFVHFLGNDGGVAFELGLVFSEIADRVVEQVAPQPAGWSFKS